MKNLPFIFALFFLVAFSFSCDEESEIEPIVQSTDTEISSMAADNGKYLGFDEYGLNINAQVFKGYLINMMFTDPAFAGMPHYGYRPYNGEGQPFWEELVAQYPYFVYFMPGDLINCEVRIRWNNGIMDRDGVYPLSWVDSDGWIVFDYIMRADGEDWTQTRKLVSSRSTDYLEEGIWFNEEGQEIGMASYYWPELIITSVKNDGYNPWIPAVMPPDYKAPYGNGYGKYRTK